MHSLLAPCRRPSFIVVLVASVLAAACATAPRPAPLGSEHRLVLGTGVFLLSAAPEDGASERLVAEALAVAVPKVERWGRFAAPVSVRIHPSHDALEQAVRRIDYPWLRAWARFDTIDIQSPRTWSMLGASRGQVVELVTHELTHILMYQRIGTASDWMRKAIPLWFREGMASVTSQQGYRRPGLPEVRRWLREHPHMDPIGDADRLYRTENDIVYGASHRAFEKLEERFGEVAIGALMDRMHAGETFERAFTASFGVPPHVFTADFLGRIETT
jgi:hypothetical protein